MLKAVRTGLLTGMVLQKVGTANSNEFPAGLSNTRTVTWWACLHPVLLSAGLGTVKSRGLCEDNMSPLLRSWWKQNWELLAQSSTQAELQNFPEILSLTSPPIDLQVVGNGHSLHLGGVFVCLPAPVHFPIGMKGSAEVLLSQNKPSCCFKARGCLTHSLPAVGSF